MKRSKGTQFNCFSPPVMIATVVIEVSLALYALWRYKINAKVRLIAIFLFALAAFQLAEYFVCTGGVASAGNWSKLGFISITALPLLALHLVHLLAEKPIGKLVIAGYTCMTILILFFLFYTEAFTGHKCTGNYVIFQFNNYIGFLYGTYYFLWMAIGNILGIIWASEINVLDKGSKKMVESLKAMVIGYYVFLVPTIIVIVLKPEATQGAPSIMCGFAVILALILGLYILPRNAKKKVIKAKT